jgi:hypothetical protein
VAGEQPLEVRPHHDVLQRARRRLAGSGVDRRLRRHVGHSHHVIEVQMGEEHARERSVLREERGEVLAHDELLLDRHVARDEAAHGARSASWTARSTPVSTMNEPRVG